MSRRALAERNSSRGIELDGIYLEAGAECMWEKEGGRGRKSFGLDFPRRDNHEVALMGKYLPYLVEFPQTSEFSSLSLSHAPRVGWNTISPDRTEGGRPFFFSRTKGREGRRNEWEAFTRLPSSSLPSPMNGILIPCSLLARRWIEKSPGSVCS